VFGERRLRLRLRCYKVTLFSQIGRRLAIELKGVRIVVLFHSSGIGSRTTIELEGGLHLLDDLSTGTNYTIAGVVVVAHYHSSSFHDHCGLDVGNDNGERWHAVKGRIVELLELALDFDADHILHIFRLAAEEEFVVPRAGIGPLCYSPIAPQTKLSKKRTNLSLLEKPRHRHGHEFVLVPNLEGASVG